MTGTGIIFAPAFGFIGMDPMQLHSPSNIAEEVSRALMQPFFFYAVAGLVVSVIMFWVLLRRFSFVSSRIKSLVFLAPLLVPLVAYALFHPSLWMMFLETESIYSGEVGKGIFTVAVKVQQVLNPLGVIAIAGLCLGGAFLAIMVVFGGRIGKRLLNIVELSPCDYPAVHGIVKGVAERAGTRVPRIGLVESLEPKAFVTGWGSRTSIVFSLGLLEMLNDQEVEAVVAHEIAHIKNRDCFFEPGVKVLRMVSFFNPFAYFAASKALREREILADEEGASLLRHPEVLGTTLIKIWSAMRAFPSEGVLKRFVLGMFIVSPLWRRIELFPSHPSLDLRLKNIIEISAGEKKPDKLKTAAVLILLAVAGVAMCYSLTNLHYSILLFTAPRFGQFPVAPFSGKVLMGTTVLPPFGVDAFPALPAEGGITFTREFVPAQMVGLHVVDNILDFKGIASLILGPAAQYP